MRMTMSSLSLACLLCSAGLAAAQPAADDVIADWSAGLGQTPAATMGFLFEVTFMKIDVADVEVRLTDADATALQALVAEGKRDGDRRNRAAAILHAADPIAYGMTFKRDSDQDRFFKGMLGNMARAVEAGELTADEYAGVEAHYRRLMAPHAERGTLKGDRLLYRLEGDTLRLLYLGADGAVLVDQQLDDGIWQRAVRASYTGEQSKLRDKLAELPWRR